MNYYKIKGSCPKAYALLIKHYSIDESLIGTRYFPEDYLGRNLYDFFDEQGICIGIIYQYYYNTLDTCDHYYFDWEIMFGVDDKIISSDVEESTRTEAEEKAFEKAFEILESKGE